MWSPTLIKVSRPECPTKTVAIEPEFQKIGLLNILILPGFIVDAITGDMMKVPEKIMQLKYLNISQYNNLLTKICYSSCQKVLVNCNPGKLATCLTPEKFQMIVKNSLEQTGQNH